MKTIIVIFILIPSLCFSQYKPKAQYRETPKKGEIVMLAGLAMVAVTATGLTHNESVSPALSKTIGVVGGCVMALGVTIDMNGNKRKNNKNKIRFRF